MRCPGIEALVYLKGKSKTAVEFGIKSVPEDTTETSIGTQATQFQDATDTTIIGTKIKDMKPKHLQEILAIIVPYIEEYSKEKQDEYAELCVEWLLQGLKNDTNPEKFMEICNIVTIEDLYMLLRVSPALQGYIQVKKDNSTISVIEIHPRQVEATGNSNGIKTSDEPEMTLVLGTKEWQQLHRQVFHTMTSWAERQKLHHMAMAWRTAIREGLTENSTWQEAKSMLCTATVVEYSHYLTACPDLTNSLKIYIDPDLYLVSYGILEHTPTEFSPIHTISAENTPSKPRKFPIKTQETIPMPCLTENPDLQDKAESEQASLKSDDGLKSQLSWDYLSNKDQTWEPCHPTHNFSFVNSLVYKVMEEWAATTQAKQHPFYGLYQHVKFNGMSCSTPWNKLCNILHIETLGQYIDFMAQCPAVATDLHLHWDKTENDIRYRWRRQHNMTDIQSQMTTLQSTYGYLKTMGFDFDMKIQKMKNLISETNEEVIRCQTRIDNQVGQSNGKITHHAATKIFEIMETAQEYTRKFQENVQSTFMEYTDKYKQHLENTGKNQLDTLKAMSTSLSSELEEALRTTAETIKSELGKFTTGTQPQVQASTPAVPTPQPPRAARFANAIIPPGPLKPRTNPYEDPPMGQPSQNDSSDDEWGRFGPSTTHPNQAQPLPLPTLYPYKMVTNVKVPYSGKDASYTWYYTFRSAVQQYGVLLLPIEQFKKDKSLCPKYYYGTKVDPLRYKDMADALYQLLQLPDTIPSEHTEVRNILNRHASTTDGYSALYEIMERIHPHLNPDAKLSPPLSVNCSDIHEYYNQLDTYFLHNSFENVVFNPRRQVNIFLEGLDKSYAPAILQIKQLLRAWREDDPPPEDLRLHSLPRTVENIMQEQDNIATIRALSHPSKQTPRPGGTPRQSKTPRPFVDIQCSYCKGWGHKRINCDKMAQYVLMQEAYKTLDDKKKAALLEAYIKTQTERKTRRIQRIKGTIRQLYTDGMSAEADALWDQCHFIDEAAENESTDSDSE